MTNEPAPGSEAWWEERLWNRATRDTWAAAASIYALTPADRASLAPPGYKLVPVEPLPEMLGAFWRVKNGHHFHDEPPPTDTSDYAAYRAMLAAAPPPPMDAAPVRSGLQDRVGKWMLDCFNAEIAADLVERCDRFIEEAFELVQALNYDPGRIIALRDYVWNRPVGEPAQEVGGVGITLAALCCAAKIDMQAAFLTELARIERPDIMAKIRAKQAAKPTGSALPAPPNEAQDRQECAKCGFDKRDHAYGCSEVAPTEPSEGVELKPCPLCGEAEDLHIYGPGTANRWTVGCGNCGLNSHDIRSRENLVAYWNALPAPAEPPVQSGWRPISEAPLSDAPVMLWIPAFVGHETAFGVRYKYPDEDSYSAHEWRDRDTGEPFETADGERGFPTHWQPLPAPPNEAQDRQECAKCGFDKRDHAYGCSEVAPTVPPEGVKLADSLRRGLEAMAIYASAPMDLWDRFSNDVLKAADALSRPAPAEPSALVEAARRAKRELEIYVDNPSAWEAFDQAISDSIRRALAALRSALEKADD